MQVTSEGPTKITKATIDAVWRRRRPVHRIVVRDKDCRGLALIVNPTGMTWVCAYRPRGNDPHTGRRWPNRTVTLGNPDTHSPDDARAEANRIKGHVAAGADPVAEKKARAADEQRKRGTTLKRLLHDYETALPSRPKMRGTGLPSSKYVTEEISLTRQAISIMQAGDMPAADLGDTEVRRVLRRSSDGAATARARFGAMSRFLDWCQDAGHIKANPCALISRSRRPKAPPARSHYLSPGDLALLWEAAAALREPVWRDLVRFLIAVPCRRGEGVRLEWSHIDLDAKEWRQPSHLTKNNDPHRLHLHGLALEVLRERLTATGGKGLVFPAPVSGRTIDTFSDMKDTLSNFSNIVGWTWHDFRRSFVTALAESGVSETIADGILNHRQSATRGGVLGVYQRASRWPEQVKAMEHWGRLLATALDPSKSDGKVIPLTTRAG